MDVPIFEALDRTQVCIDRALAQYQSIRVDIYPANYDKFIIPSTIDAIDYAS